MGGAALGDLGELIGGVVGVSDRLFCRALGCLFVGFSLALAAGGVGVVAYGAGGVGAFNQLVELVVAVGGGAAHGPGFGFKLVVFVVGEAVGVADEKNINLRKYPYSL